MQVLLLIPKIIGYQARLGSNIALTQAISGMPRRRRISKGATHQVSISFTLTEVHFDYLMAFWRLTKAERFACRLIIENSQMRWYVSRWLTVPMIKNHGGGVFEFSCDLLVGDASVLLPPLKFASHLYPLYQDDGYQSSLSVLNSSLTHVYHEIRQQDNYQSNLTAKSGLLKQVYFMRDYTHKEPEHYQSSLSVKSALLKQVYFMRDYTHKPPEVYQAQLKTKDSRLEQVYWYLKYTHPTEDAYVSSLNVLDSKLVKVE